MKNKLHRKIYGDCIRATALPIVLYGVQECFAGILSVVTADLLGRFANAVFALDFAFGRENLGKLLLCIALTVGVCPMMMYVANYFMIKNSIAHDRMVLGRFLDKEYASVLRLEAGDIQHRLDWDPTNLRCYFVAAVTDSLYVVVTLVYLLICALAVSPLYTWIVFAISLGKLGVPVAVRKMEAWFDKKKREYSNTVGTYEDEIVRQPHAVRQYGVAEAMIARMDRIWVEHFAAVESKSIVTGRVTGGISGFLDTFCTFAVLLTGAVLAARGDILPGTVAAMVGYFGVFGSLMGKVSELIRDTPKLANITERMEIFYEDEEDLAGEDAPELREIRADGLKFTYVGSERAAFEGLSFVRAVDGKTAVCGANGSGKSTFIKILCGLLRPYSGSLTVDGLEFSKISPEKWREHVAYAPQEPVLFAGTVRENIRLGNRSATDAEVDAVLGELGMSDLAERVVEPGKSDFSGGEKQKISVARALMKNARLLILDEPGNNLDAATVAWLEDFLRKTTRSVVYITHDRAMEELADAVVRL